MNFHKLKNETEILYRPEEIEKSSNELAPGIYSLIIEQGLMGPSKISLRPLSADNLIAFSDGVIRTFLKEVDIFFSPETKSVYDELKIKHSVGYILYGKPGTGKTCLCTLAMSELAKKYQAVCIDMTKTPINMAKQMVQIIRGIQSNPIVLFLDECDRDIQQQEHSFLPFLDGNETMDGLIFLGCTNNLERIPDRIKHRKSRIKRCFEIKNLPLKVYQEYLQERLPGLKPEVFSEVCYKAMERELNIDQFKNALLDYRLLNLTIDKAIDYALENYSVDERIDDEEED